MSLIFLFKIGKERYPALTGIRAIGAATGCTIVYNPPTIQILFNLSCLAVKFSSCLNLITGN